ncbi:Clp protease N-terminal domain-containing protein [Arthrobacter sp. H35-D1]|uniref:Clp protease N-terminal domain-containing protein n=1 Tax=Arthrobacter sp. H35-D1 TaxID=3046202 RepID=UPI0024BA3CB8|nr:Clp protease N-terminal domain-containing protein [Arthrobacter sp. H35-D1]MDJ0313394.1 Clp protease N-terminal domain-containing protein [Arthrobacter sp. H35-D1]
MFENYTDDARRAVVLAQEESRGMMHDSFIGPEHLLLGLLHADPDAVDVALGVRSNEVRVAIMSFASPGPQDTSESLPFTRGSLDALEAAQRTARALHSDHVGIEHLLFGVLSVHGDRLDRALVAAGVDRDGAQTRIMAALTQGRSAGQGWATGNDPPPTSG